MYNTKKVESFQNDLPIFYAIYNISAMKMHQLHEQIGSKLIGVFTDTIVVEGDINKIECNKHIIDFDIKVIILQYRRTQISKILRYRSFNFDIEAPRYRRFFYVDVSNHTRMSKFCISISKIFLYRRTSISKIFRDRSEAIFDVDFFRQFAWARLVQGCGV